MTICAKCKHFVCNGPIWYDQFCSATPKPKTVNPVTGEEGYRGINDLGTVYFTDQPFQYARDINTDGNCQLFTSK